MSVVEQLRLSLREITRQFRLRKSVMSYEEIAEACGIQPATLSRFHHGQGVGHDTLLKLARWIDATTEDGATVSEDVTL